MKRLLLLSAAAIAFLAAACGGGGTSSTPPPPTGGFTNSSLKGQYAFSMSGSDLNARFIARVGSFTADGNGNITSATEDVIDTGVSGGIPRTVFTGGNYSIQANGKGTLTLTQNATSGLGLSITLASTSAGLMVQTDTNATSSGSFELQSPGAFATAGINGNYVFSVSGVEGTVGAPLAVMGQFATDSSGGIPSGVIDINDGALTSVTPPAAIPAGGTYGAESANQADLAAFGRGAITFDGFTFVFYIVDSTHLLLLEEDTSNVTFGDALQQSGAIPAQSANFTGSFAFLVGGSSVLGTMGPDARAGAFTADGSGNLSKVFLDENNAGKQSSVAGNATSAAYAIDTSAIALNRGRGTLTFTSSTGLGTFVYVFYLYSPTAAVIQDQSNGLISSGAMLSQPSSISASTLAGNYAFNWSGVVLPSTGNVGFEEDFVGQYTQSSSAAIAGAVDFTELGTTSNRPIFSNSALSGNFTLAGDPSTSNTYQITIASSGVSGNTFNYRAYVANGNTIFLVGHDSNQVITGTVSVQH